MGATIEDISIHLPKKVLTNKNLKSRFDDFDSNKIENKIGIKQRHIATNETTIDLAYEAGLKILQKHNKDEIDAIVLCTQTPDYFLPTGACILQKMLGLSKNVSAFDFNLGCSGYVYGLAIIKGLLESKIASKALFLTSDTYTKFIHEEDKGNRSIFGDGASATIISFHEVDKLGAFELGTDGSGFNDLIIKNGAGKNKYDFDPQLKSYGDRNNYTDNCIYMNGPEIFNFTINNIPPLINATLKKNKLTLKDVDYFIFHQANKFMLNYLRRKLGIKENQFHLDLEMTGNTVSSTIPIALTQALERNKIKEGDKVLIAGFGVGLSWGATVIKI
jgi:3-oxoacyl-[acyl-carrier-protein] synthase-3